MKIKDIFLIIAVFCATVLPATMVVFGGMIFIASCGDPTYEKLTEQKTYGIQWMSGSFAGDTGVWETHEEYYLGQFVYTPHSEARFRVITLPAGAKVKAIKAGTNKIEVITLNSPASAGDTVIASRGVYHIPQ